MNFKVDSDLKESGIMGNFAYSNGYTQKSQCSRKVRYKQKIRFCCNFGDL